jgi:hypothetical protein
MKFNMGCGRRRLDGFVNVDSSPVCEPDEVWDLEVTPWPWADDCAEEVHVTHSLEHMGATSTGFLAIIKELYRICAPGCRIEVAVPHPRHDDFLNDPTHVRPITPELMSLFDRARNDAWQASGAANSPLAHYTGVDFRIEHVARVLAEPYSSQLRSGALTAAELADAVLSRNNVIKEIRLTLQAVKP